MSLLRLILWMLVFYVIIKTIGNVFKFFTAGATSSANQNIGQKPSKYKIEKDDVIDAHFEDIDSNKSEKPKDNS
jgi:hypothetical protein